jgi:CheY-like chemotaxis protein
MIPFNPADARSLIVDDTDAYIALLTNILGRIGYHQLRGITDPRETLTELEGFRPDLIILDLMMAHLDGFQVIQQLDRIIPRETYLPVLVLTADICAAVKRKALASGATDFLKVVDDEAVPRDVVSKYLHADGHDVVEVTGAHEALDETLAERDFDLVVTDPAMPRMNGTQLAQLIKAERANQPVLMLTGYTDSSLSPAPPPPVVDLKLAKPIAQRDLRSAISRLLPA